MFIESFKNLNVYKNIYKKDKNNREINIYQIEDITFLGENIIYPNCLLKKEDKLIEPIMEKTMSLPDTVKKEMDILEENKKEKEILDFPLFFFIYNTSNYYHFLYDTVPYLISYFKLKKHIKNLKLIMSQPTIEKRENYKFVTEILEILNISKEDIVLAEKDTIYKKLYISTSYTHDFDSNTPPRNEIFDFYKEIVKRVEKILSFKETPKKIYISRRTNVHNNLSNIGTNYTTRRKMVNEDDLVIKLKELGYVEVFTENLTMYEKILYFSRCSDIIGSIGGGIANVLFSNNNTNLEAIISPEFLEINTRFRYCLENVNVYYNYSTHHVENNYFKKYMRVKIKNSSFLGEIIDYDSKYLTVKLSEKRITGWELGGSYKIQKIDKKDVEKLDNGLNSKYYFDINSIILK